MFFFSGVGISSLLLWRRKYHLPHDEIATLSMCLIHTHCTSVIQTNHHREEMVLATTLNTYNGKSMRITTLNQLKARKKSPTICHTRVDLDKTFIYQRVHAYSICDTDLPHFHACFYFSSPGYVLGLKLPEQLGIKFAFEPFISPSLLVYVHSSYRLPVQHP